jgi:glycosyltransferase involved in cell wall biosynthesis
VSEPPNRVALAADYLIFLRGAERTFAQMASCWPEASIYACAYREEATEGRFVGRDVRTSFLQRLGVTRSWFRLALPLYPRAVESLPVAEHDVLVSSSFAFAHGLRPGPGAVHVCYCHSPFRQAWHERERALREAPAPLRPVLRRMLDRIRDWDVEASTRVTHYVANSEVTRERIAEFWGRDSEVVHPPVEVERFQLGEPEDYFLFVGELVSHKRIEVALEAARLAGKPIVVVGGGPELERLRSRYGASAEFRGRIPDEELVGVYSRARCLVLPNVEEFGIAAVEAQASGRPVLALDAGGARETVIAGSTGVLVEGGRAEDFAEAMREVDFDRFDPAAARANAERFSAARFREQLAAIVERTAAER